MIWHGSCSIENKGVIRMAKRRHIWFNVRDEILGHPYVQQLSLEARSALVQDIRDMTLTGLKKKLSCIEKEHRAQQTRTEASTEQ